MLCMCILILPTKQQAYDSRIVSTLKTLLCLHMLRMTLVMDLYLHTYTTVEKIAWIKNEFIFMGSVLGTRHKPNSLSSLIHLDLVFLSFFNNTNPAQSREKLIIIVFPKLRIIWIKTQSLNKPTLFRLIFIIQ